MSSPNPNQNEKTVRSQPPFRCFSCGETKIRHSANRIQDAGRSAQLAPHPPALRETTDPPSARLYSLPWLTQSLDQERRVFAVDMRNHGASSHHDSMTYVDMANDVLGFLADKVTRRGLLRCSSIRRVFTLGVFVCYVESYHVIIHASPIFSGHIIRQG